MSTREPLMKKLDKLPKWATDEFLTEARKMLHAQRKSIHDCVWYTVIYEGDKEARGYHTACYATICDYPSRTGTALVVVNNLQSMTYREEYPKELVIRYLDYLMNRSPWSDAFLIKDAERAYGEKVTFHRCDVPSNYMVGALTAVRNISEEFNKNHIHHWAALVEAGCSEDWAWLLGWNTYLDSQRWSLTRGVSGHCVWNGGSSVDNYEGYLKGKVRQANDTLADKAKYYKPVNYAFAGDKWQLNKYNYSGGAYGLNQTPKGFLQWLKITCKELSFGVVVKDTDKINPFAVASQMSNNDSAYSIHEFPKIIVAAEERFRKEFKVND